MAGILAQFYSAADFYLVLQATYDQLNSLMEGLEAWVASGLAPAPDALRTGLLVAAPYGQDAKAHRAQVPSPSHPPPFCGWTG